MTDRPAAASNHWWKSITRPRRRWWALSVIGVAAGLAVGGSVVVTGGIDRRGEPADCEFNEFDAPMQIDAMSPNGKYLVGMPADAVTDTDITFGLWHEGEYSEGKVSVESYSDLVDVNDSGDVLGHSSYDSVIWRYIDGELQYLKAPDGSSEVVPTAIGADGTVVGNTGEEDAPQPVKWSPDSVTATTLDIGDHLHGSAVDIAADGTIVGSVGDGAADRYSGGSIDAWAWDADGNGRKILGMKTLPGRPQAKIAGTSEALSITGDWVLVTTDAGRYRVNLNNPNDLHKVKIDPVALDQNGREYGSKKDEPAVYDDKVVTLPGLSAPPPPDEEDEFSNQLLAASADGSRIAGRTWDGKEVLWICDGSSLPDTVKVPADDSDTDGPPKGAKACDVQALAEPEGKDFAVETHVSPDGSYAAIGIAYLNKDKSDSFGLWHDGRYTEVDGVPELGNVDVHGVNNSGTVIGESSDPNDSDRFAAWRYQDGEVQSLDLPSATDYGHVHAIAEDGTIVGDFMDSKGGSGPLMWKPGQSVPTALDNDGNSNGEALDISDSGIIVGSRPEKKDYALKAWMWDTDGNSVPLPNMVTEDFYASGATAVAGDWVLLYTEENSDYTYYRYNLKDKSEPERVKLTEANDIDEDGRVYGTNGSSLSVYDDAFIDQPGLHDGSGKGSAMADQINSATPDGSVFTGHSANKAAMWTCG